MVGGSTLNHRFLAASAGLLLLLGTLASAWFWTYPGQYSGSSVSYFYNTPVVPYSSYSYYSYYPTYYTPVYVQPASFCGDYVCNYWESHYSCPYDCVVGGSPYVLVTKQYSWNLGAHIAGAPAHFQPDVFLNGPANNTLTNATPVTFNFTAIDDVDPLLRCAVTVGSSFVSPAGGLAALNNTPTLFSTALADGAHNWNVTCTDLAGNLTTSETRLVTIDTNAPLAQLTSPANNSFTRNTTPNFEFTAIDNLANPFNCTLVVDGNPTVTGTFANNTPSRLFAPALLPGPHTWALSCMDTANNTQLSLAHAFAVDVVAPVVTLTAPANTSVLGSRTSLFNFTALDDRSANLSCTLFLNGTATATNTSVANNVPTSFNLTNLAEGPQTWVVNCTDLAGNNASSSVFQFTVDTQSPGVTLNSPANGAILNTSTASFNFTAIDTRAPTLSCSLLLNGTVSATNNSVVSGTPTLFSISGLGDGRTNWAVNCTDGVQSINSTVRNFTIDTTVPDLSLLAPAAAAALNQTPVSFTFLAIDRLSPLLSCNLTLNGSVAASNNSVVNNTNTTFSLSPADGSYNWSVACIDNAGNRAQTANQTFQVDANPAGITLLSPANGFVTASASPSFNFTVTDAIDSELACALLINGTVNATGTARNNTPTILTAANLPEGSYPWAIRCTDDANNTRASENRTLVVDLAGPVVSVVSPAANGFTRDTTPEFSFNTTDRFDRILECALYVDGVRVAAANATNATAVTLTTPIALADGSHSWNVTCTDDAGTPGVSASQAVIVDTQAPSVSLGAPSEGSSLKEKRPAFVFTPTDILASTNLTCEVLVDSTRVASNASVNSGSAFTLIPTVDLSDGAKTWAAACTDPAGNRGTSAARPFSVDTTPATVSLVSPAEGATLTDDTPELAFVASDGVDASLNCTVSVSGAIVATPVAPRSTQVAVNTSQLTPGAKVWSVSCTDDAGNVAASNSRAFLVQTTDTFSSIPTGGAAGPTPRRGARCSDGTGSNACSFFTKPLFCQDGVLVENAVLCGCPAGTRRQGNRCTPVCIDGTLNGTCSLRQPYFCQEGLLLSSPALCGCPQGTVVQGNRCIGIQPTCQLSANPNPVNALSPSAVTIQFFELENAPSSARVDCGNGQVATATCTSTGTAPFSGTCTATCTYAEQEVYPQTPLIRGSIAVLSCGSTNIRVLPPVSTTGSLLTKLSACETGVILPNARAKVFVNGSLLYDDLSTDANGELALAKLSPGAYTVEFNTTAYGLALARASAVVEAGRTKVVSACAEKSICDIKMELVRAPSTSTPAALEAVQVRLTNRVNAPRTISLSNAGSLIPFTTLGSFSLSALEQRLITLTPIPSADTVGASNTMIAGEVERCNQYLEIPLFVQGGLTLEANRFSQAAFGGTEACFDLLVRNRGALEGSVTLSSQGLLTVSFDTPTFFLGRQEARVVQACASVPAGAEARNYPLTFRATAPSINDASLPNILVNVPSTRFSTTNACLTASRVEGHKTIALSVSNGALGGDYEAVLDASAFQAGASLQQPILYNFAKGETRPLYLRVDPFAAQGGEHRFNLAIKALEDGRVVQQLPLCVRVEGDQSAQGQLSASLISATPGQTELVRYEVQNTGNREEVFLVKATTTLQGVSVNPTTIRLLPGHAQAVDVLVSVSPNTPANRYDITLEVYAGTERPENLLRTDVLQVVVTPASTPTPVPATLVVEVTAPSVVVSQGANGSSEANLTFSVTSREQVPVQVIPSLEGLPTDWAYTFDGNALVLSPGQTVNFTAHMQLVGVEANREYPGTFVLTSGVAKFRNRFVFNPSAPSLLSGLFTLGSVQNLALLVLIALAALAGYFYYRARELEQTSEYPNYLEPTPTQEATL